MVVTAAFGVRWRAWVQAVGALGEDEFHVLSRGRDCQPTRTTGLLVIRAFLESKDLRIKLKGFVLVAHDDGCVGQFHALCPPLEFQKT
jgi:hypothetical protein